MSLSKKPLPLLWFSIIPALLFGTYTMAYFEVPKSLWMMNLGFGLIGIALQLVFFRFRPVFNNVNPYPIIFISILLMILTFLDEGFQNVHRWVSIGNFRVNIGLIVSPLILLATLFGKFPVMVMGYGISPIIGYFIGLIWLGEGVSKL